MKKLVEIVCVCVVNFVSIFFTILIKGNGVIWITSIEYFFLLTVIGQYHYHQKRKYKEKSKTKDN